MARSLVKDSTIYGIGTMLTRALGLLLIPVYTRFLETSEYGALSLLNLILQQVSFVCLLGVSTASIRHYYDTDADEALRQKVYGTATTLLLVFPALVLMVLVPVTWWLVDRFLPSVPFFPYVLVVLLTGLFTPLPKLLQGLMRARRRPVHFTLFNLGFFAFQTAAIYVAMAVLDGGLAGQVYAQLLANGVFAAIALALLAGYARPRLDRSMARDLLAFGLPLVPFFIFLWLYEGAGRFMLEHYTGLAQVGLFALAAQFAGIVMLASATLDNVMMPSFMELAGRADGGQRLGDLVAKYLVWLGLLGLCMLVVASPAIRVFATDKYFEAEHYVAPLVLAYWLSMARTPVIWSLNYSKRSAALSWLNGVGVLVLVGLLALFLGGLGYGINGVAAALALANLVNIAVGVVVAQRYFRLHLPLGRLLPAAGVILLAGALIAWMGPAGLDWRLLLAQSAVLAAGALAAMRLARIGNPLRAFARG